MEASGSGAQRRSQPLDSVALQPPVDATIRQGVRRLYLGSGGLFLITVVLGILNVFTERPLPRGQMLAHFHSGTIGWVTLSVVATTLWVYGGQSTLGPQLVALARWIPPVGVVAVAGYILAFFVAFNTGDSYWMLPLFGIPTAIVIWSGLGFALAALKTAAPLTTTHLLMLGALLVASAGAVMGLLWGLTYSTGISPYPEAADPIGAHAAPMDMYLALAFAGTVEWLLRGSTAPRWSKPGMTQMLLGVLSAAVAIVSLYFGIEPLVPLGLLGFLIGFFIYFARVGWRTFSINPLKGGRAPAVFWGGLWFPVYIVLFVILVFVFFVPGEDIPAELGVVFVHATFVGMATNLLLAVQSTYAGGRIGRLEPAGVWLLNLGMLAFFLGEFAARDRQGALLMAVGVLAALAAVWKRLSKPAATPAR